MNWLSSFNKLRPKERLAPHDGMAITLDTWNAAHKYHTDLLQSALLASRGCGILDGLAVTLEGERIQVSAGVAINPIGQLLIFEGSSVELKRDLNTSRNLDIGVVRIALQSTQSPKQGKPSYAEESSQLVVEMSDTPQNETEIEVARVDLSVIDAIVKLPRDPDKPTKDELDLRYRLYIGQRTPLHIALVKVETSVSDDHMQGWRTLAREVSYITSRPILLDEWNDQTLPNNDGLAKYDMICIVSCNNLRPIDGKRAFLAQYLNGGGILFYESCRQTQRAGITSADQQFHEWIAEIAKGQQLEKLMGTDVLSRAPYTFREIPRGYDDPSIRDFRITRKAGKGIAMFSNLDYGCAFCGKYASTNQPSRAMMRETLEWGHNLLALVGNRNR